MKLPILMADGEEEQDSAVKYMSVITTSNNYNNGIGSNYSNDNGSNYSRAITSNCSNTSTSSKDTNANIRNSYNNTLNNSRQNNNGDINSTFSSCNSSKNYNENSRMRTDRMHPLYNTTESDSEDDQDINKDERKPWLQRRKQIKQIEVSKEYYRISMQELRSYENLLKIFILASLKRVGLCVIEDFLPQSIATGVSEEVSTLANDSIVSFRAPTGCEDYRGDDVYWVGTNAERENCSNITKLEKHFHKLILSMVHHEKELGNLFKITHKSRTEISCFKSGDIGYKPHIDNPNNNGRLLSVSFFCNKNYTKIEDGGLVRFYVDNNKKFVELQPSYNMAVIHWSDRRVVKEILPATTKNNLFHLNSWFFGVSSDIGGKRRLQDN